MLHFVRKVRPRSGTDSGIGRCFKPFVILAVFLHIGLSAAAGAAGEAAHGAVNCDAHGGVCVQKLDGAQIFLDIQPKPVKAMTDLRFRVKVAGRSPSAPPTVDLGMPGMKMGPNRVELTPLKPGEFEGTGVIVRCPSGKRVWKASVTVPDLGTVEFVFDVIY